MKKITIEAVQAFEANENFSKSNTQVTTENNETKLFLFGNLIAKKDNTGTYITSAGWHSNTTKERLNGINGVSIQQKNFVWYLNGKKWENSNKLTKI